MIRKLRDLALWAAHSRRRPEVAPQEGRHSHHGRIADRYLDCGSTLLWADLSNRYIWIALLGLVGFGLVGFFDDYAKIAKKRNLGMTARQKILGIK